MSVFYYFYALFLSFLHLCTLVYTLLTRNNHLDFNGILRKGAKVQGFYIFSRK